MSGSQIDELCREWLRENCGEELASEYTIYSLVMLSTNYTTRQPEAGMKRGSGDVSLFDNLAIEYNAWFDREGSLIFCIEVQAFRGLLPSLPKPWLEIGVGSGRFAQALGIETGVDPFTYPLRDIGE